MFNWAQQTFDKLSQTVAPPPTDGAGRFAYAVQSNDEASAMGCLAEIDAFTTIVNQAKGMYPIHMACASSMVQLVRMMMNQPGANLDVTDGAGNTPMHHAAMSTKAGAVELCKILISEYGASAMVKNFAGQTPYDISTVSTVRQYLLPIQLQAETQHAIDNGGMGLPPGIDMGGLRIKNSAMPPPPSQFGAGPPSASAPAPPPPMGFGQPHGYATTASSPVPAAAGGPAMFATPSPAEPNRPYATSTSPAVAPAPASMPAHLEQAPTSGNREYARVGSSSAAIFSKPKDGSRTFVRPDGFHSSSSDVSLQRKYGHQPVGGHQSAVPPPPSSGGGPLPTAPMSAGANPFAAGSSLGGASRYGALPPSNRRYVAYGPTAPAPAPATGQPAYNYHAPAPMTAPGVTMFTPGGASQQQPQAPAPFTPQATMASPQGYQQGTQTAQHSQVPPTQSQQMYQQQQPSPSNSFLPPPPYQTESYQAQNVQTQQQQLPPHTVATPSTPAHSRAYTPSPSGATYGSTMTPGTTLETPGALGVNPSSSNAIPGTEAKELFSSPPAAGSSATPDVNNTPMTGNSAALSPSPQAPSNSHSQTTPAYAQQPARLDPVGSTSSPAQALFGAIPGPTSAATATEQPSTIPHSKSAEELFGEGPPVEQHGHQQVTGLTAEPTVQTSAPAELPERARTMSADELFAAPAPSPQQPTSETSAADSQFEANQPSYNMGTSAPQGQALGNNGVASDVFARAGGGSAGSGSAEQAFGAGLVQSTGPMPVSQPNIDRSGGQPSMSQVQAPVGSANASDFFGGPSRGTAGSGSAEQVFGTAASQDPMPQQPASQDRTHVEETTTGVDGESEDLMTEVPLSPRVAGSEKRGSLLAESKAPQSVNSQPVQDTAPSGGESLFAAIGLPPPPVSSRR